MLRGYQKRVVYLKNTGSEIFKEAYFVIEDTEKAASNSTKKLVDEANRIINENFYGRRGKLSKRIVPYLSFLAGIGLSCAVFLVYLFIR